MKKLIFLLFFVMLIVPNDSFAIENPLSVANNKFGIHILFTNELKDAAKLVNSQGGDWGYVTIPIQAGDRDLEKWQKFMDTAKDSHIIPIIRLATEGDYFNTKVWRKPKFEDVLDFANFLDSLEWPTKNRYIIVFNEVNRSDEWGGSSNPKEYAQILNYAVTVFKSKSQDFFIISAGLDNASVNVPGTSFNEYDFMRKMNDETPGIFNQIDGLSSHSYPNPAFSKPPTIHDQMSIASFKYERELAKSLSTGKELPVFITETGWSKKRVSQDVVRSYYKIAFEDVWNNENVIAVTPFLLKAFAGPFTDFSFIKEDGQEDTQYKAIEDLPKVKGAPIIQQTVLGEDISKNMEFPTKNFSNEDSHPKFISKSKALETIVKWLLKI